MQQKWAQRIGQGELIVLPSPYRLLPEPIKTYIGILQAETPGAFVHVIMVHPVMDTYWEQALHQNTAFIFNLALGRLEWVIVTNVPFQTHRRPDGHHVLEQPARRSPTGVA